MHPAIAVWCNRIKQVERNIEVAECAAVTGIRDGGNSVCVSGRVVDRDLLVANGIAVRIADGRHYEVREGNDRVAILVGNAAGA